MEALILVRYGEIALKGNNRPAFENMLIGNMKNVVKPLGGKVEKRHGRILVSCGMDKLEEVQDELSRVFGIVSFSPGVAVEPDMGKMREAAIAQLRVTVESGTRTFKVECRRANKGFPMKSPEICNEIGGDLLEAFPQLTVDVHHPDTTVTIEIREKVYIFTQIIKGIGGMPYKSAGKAMLLLSGGIDSPVAGYMMARRGVQVEGIHFHSYPFTSERALEKVLDLARKLTVYTGHVRVHSINLLEVQRAIQEHCPEEEMTILSRRFMMQIAQRVAQTRKCQALITGESIGQVASQTMEGLTVTNSAVDIPVFRPLIALDKVEIIEIARRIDTFETSILPFEDCCTVFLPDRVVTKPRVADIEASQALLDSEGLIERAIEGAQVYDLRRQG